MLPFKKRGVFPTEDYISEFRGAWQVDTWKGREYKKRMKSAPDERPLLILRKTRENRYTLPALLGCLEKEGLSRNFHILIPSSLQEIAQRKDLREAVVGFSFMTPYLDRVRQEVEALRIILPVNSCFLAGGSHPSGDPEGTLQLGFDFVFVGEAETAFPGFLREFLSGEIKSGKIVQNGIPPNQGRLDHPSFSLEQRFFAPLEITRGCFYNCAFCQTPRIFGRSPRHRTPENVARSLRGAVAFGYVQSKFISPNAFSYGSPNPGEPDLPAVGKFLAACREAGLEGIHFGCYPSEVRPDWVNPEILELIKKHCRNRTIVLGAQSGSDSLLSRIWRGHTAKQAWDAVKSISRAGFTPHVDFVFGFPGETLEDRRASLTLMEEMMEKEGARIHAHTYMPLPATPLFRETPSALEDDTRNALRHWRKKRKLDGWWEEQEIVAWKIVKWRDQGRIREKGRELAVPYSA